MYVHACRLIICRLPIVQGGTFTFVAPSIAILSLPRLACPAAPTTSATPSDDGAVTTMASTNVSDMNLTTTLTADDDTPAWHYRIREVSNKHSKWANSRGLSNIQKIVMRVCREGQWACTRKTTLLMRSKLFFTDTRCHNGCVTVPSADWILWINGLSAEVHRSPVNCANHCSSWIGIVWRSNWVSAQTCSATNSIWKHPT